MAKIHPSAVVDPTAQIGKDVVIGPNCNVEAGAKIGDGCILDANVVIGRDVVIGQKNIFYPNVVIGKNPQMLGATPDTPHGALTIGNNNMFRELVTIHPSIYLDTATSVGDNNLLMVGAHIGHDCIIEDQTVISNMTQISGHCKVETGAWLSGSVLIHQFSTVGKWSYATALTGINHDIPPFLTVSGHYPPEIRLINERGMVRAGLNETQQQAILDAFKFLYKNDKPLIENVKTMAAQKGLDENVKYMVDFILRSTQHRFGRYLESLRRKH